MPTALELQKREIEQQLARVRSGLGERVDELDLTLRKKLDVETLASEHINELMIGGAVVGFLVAFGVPKILRRVIQIGVPIAVSAWKVQQARARRAATANDGAGDDAAAYEDE